MSVELIISPPATGKTEACIRRIKIIQTTQPLAKVWVIVPDRLQAAMFRHRLAATGGAIGVQVGRFDDLFHAILEGTGSYVPAASAPLLHRLIQDTVDRAVDQNAIPYFQPLQIFPGFIQVLRDAFAELKRALIYPEKFSEYAKSRSDAQRDLAVLYAGYQLRLRELKWADPEDIMMLAVEELERNSEANPGIRFLVVDGFDSFDGAQHRVLELLAEQVDELLVTFPGMRNSSRPAHHRFTDTIERLVRELNPEVTSPDNTPCLPLALQHLEHNLFNAEPPGVKIPTEPFMLEARSPADEAREALRWIKQLVVRKGIPLSGCAIFTPSPEVYHPVLRASADEFGIPIRFTLDESMANSPVVAALINLLSLPAVNFGTRQLINTLRSPYFDFSLDTQTIDTLERVSRLAQIVEGKDQWQTAWERLEYPASQEKTFLDDERKAPDLPRGLQAAALRRVMEDVFQTVTPPDHEQTVTDWITWVEDLLEHLRLYEWAEGERDQAACDTFREILRALVLSESVVGQRQVNYARFLSDLKGTLAGEVYREPGIAGKPTLLVGRMTEARGTRFQAVVLLGLSEGSFPLNERPDPFLSEDLRANLGLEPRLGREQTGLFYQAVTRADHHLLITRPSLSSDGEEWEASSFWKAAAVLFDKSAVIKNTPDALLALEDAASTQEMLFSALRRKGLPLKFDFLLERWRNLQHAQAVLQARRSKKIGGPYEGLVEGVTSALEKRYTPLRGWSASSLEAYGNCPFRFFVHYALELEPRTLPKLGLEIRQLGTILHEILEQTYKNAADPANLDAVLESLQREAKKVFAIADQKNGFRPSALWKNEQVQLLEKLEKTIRELAEDGQWTAFAYEQKYGLEGLPILEIELEEETIRLHGVIDRVDKNAAGQLRVIDYKTGGTFKTADLENGHRLQLPIYALAARDALRLGVPVEGMYWSINAAEPGSLRLSTFSIDEEKGIEVAYEVARKHLQRIVKGIRSGEFSPEIPEAGCPNYCPAAQWCWRYEAGW